MGAARKKPGRQDAWKLTAPAAPWLHPTHPLITHEKSRGSARAGSRPTPSAAQAWPLRCEQQIRPLCSWLGSVANTYGLLTTLSFGPHLCSCSWSQAAPVAPVLTFGHLESDETRDTEVRLYKMPSSCRRRGAGHGRPDDLLNACGQCRRQISRPLRVGRQFACQHPVPMRRASLIPSCATPAARAPRTRQVYAPRLPDTFLRSMSMYASASLSVSGLLTRTSPTPFRVRTARSLDSSASGVDGTPLAGCTPLFELSTATFLLAEGTFVRPRPPAPPRFPRPPAPLTLELGLASGRSGVSCVAAAPLLGVT